MGYILYYFNIATCDINFKVMVFVLPFELPYVYTMHTQTTFACIHVTALQCPPLRPIDNGILSYSPDNTPDYNEGTVVTYTCNAGFVLDLTTGGSETRTCVIREDNVAWDSQEPRCVRK